MRKFLYNPKVLGITMLIAAAIGLARYHS